MEAESLVERNHPQKKQRRLRYAFLIAVAGVAATCLVAGALQISRPDVINKLSSILRFRRSAVQAKDPFTFDDIFNGEYVAKYFVPRWVGDSNYYVYRTEAGALIEFNADTNVTTQIMDNTTFISLGTGTYYVSEDRQYVLLAYQMVSVWRRSFEAKYKIYDRNAAEGQRLLDFPNHPTLKNQLLQFAGWSSKGNALSFVQGNNLFMQSSPSAESAPLTTSGKPPYIFNGIPDWLYEEDVTSDRVAHYWSPASRYLAYFKFDTTTVPVFKMPWYGPSSDVYPATVEFTYPKAGNVSLGKNTKVELYIVDTTQPAGPQVRIQPPAEFQNVDHYYNQVGWRDDTHIMVAWTNRVQNITILSICDVTTGNCQKNYELVVVGGWSTVPWPKMQFINNGQQHLTILPKSEGSSGSWKHLAYVTAPLDAEGQVTFLTSGEQTVTAVVGYDPDTKLVYYISTNGDQKKRHIFRVGTPAAERQLRAPTCLTCSVSTDSQYYSASFSGTGRYYVEMSMGPGIPQYRLKGNKDGRNVILEDNAALKQRLDNKALPIREFHTIPVGGGYQGNLELLLPPNFDAGQKYPLMVYTYAGPGSQMVSERFRLMGSFQTAWHTHLVSQQNVVVAMVDGRGTANKGDKFMHEIYRRWGTVEIEDQMLAAQYLLDNYSWLDKNKTAIYGWSNGGYTTSHAMGNESDVYKCGIAVAPCANYYYYDTAFAERFLAMAVNDNEKGYYDSDITHKAKNFRNKKYLIVHGSADDNVHYQHAAQIIKALVEENIQFNMQVYIDKNHSISGVNTSPHLFRRLTDFLLQQCYSYPNSNKKANKSKGKPQRNENPHPWKTRSI